MADSTAFSFGPVLGAVLLLAAGFIISLLRAISKKLGEHGETLVRMETILTGATGDNGLSGDMKDAKLDVQFVLRHLGIDRRHGDSGRRLGDCA